MSKNTKIQGTLEIDHARGVVYFHAAEQEIDHTQAVTVLRVSNISAPIPQFPGDGEYPTVLDLRIMDDSALQAAIDKLPTFADTGKRFVPGRDVAWALMGTHGRRPYIAAPHFNECRNKWIATYYSTPEAAEAAKGSAKHDD